MFFKVTKTGDTVYKATDADVKLANNILAILNRDKNVNTIRSVFNAAKDDIMAPKFGLVTMGLNVFADEKSLSGDMLKAIKTQRENPEVYALFHAIIHAASNKALKSKIQESAAGNSTWVRFNDIDDEIRQVAKVAADCELKSDILEKLKDYPKKSPNIH